MLDSVGISSDIITNSVQYHRLTESISNNG